MEKKLLVMDWFQSRDNWLMVFDNADDNAVSYEEWMPTIRHLKTYNILFTTGDDRLAGRLIAGINQVHRIDHETVLRLFNAGKSTAFSYDHGLAMKLIKQLGNLPLAISLASEFLRQYPLVSLSEYLEQFNDYAQRQTFWNFKEAYSNYNHSLMSTWELSFLSNTEGRCSRSTDPDVTWFSKTI
jgi:hypothetical protein